GRASGAVRHRGRDRRPDHRCDRTLDRRRRARPTAPVPTQASADAGAGAPLRAGAQTPARARAERIAIVGRRTTMNEARAYEPVTSAPEPLRRPSFPSNVIDILTVDPSHGIEEVGVQQKTRVAAGATAGAAAGAAL